MLKAVCVAICCSLFPFLLPSAAVSDEGVTTRAQGTIRATAHVEAPLGLSEVTGAEEYAGIKYSESGHMYWLYHPDSEGVRILVADQAHKEGPMYLQEGELVSLVKLDLEDSANSVSVTLIFIDN